MSGENGRSRKGDCWYGRDSARTIITVKNMEWTIEQTVGAVNKCEHEQWLTDSRHPTTFSFVRPSLGGAEHPDSCQLEMRSQILFTRAPVVSWITAKFQCKSAAAVTVNCIMCCVRTDTERNISRSLINHTYSLSDACVLITVKHLISSSHSSLMMNVNPQMSVTSTSGFFCVCSSA